MSWNHRIVKHMYNGEPWYGIYEVYYDEYGKPKMRTKKPIAVEGDSEEDIKWVLDNMAECVDKPVLDDEIFKMP